MNLSMNDEYFLELDCESSCNVDAFIFQYPSLKNKKNIFYYKFLRFNIFIVVLTVAILNIVYIQIFLVS